MNITKHLLVLAGSTLGTAGVISHIPAEKAKSSVEVRQKYFTNNRYDGHKSEQRKQELLSDIRGIRKQIRAMATEQYRNKFDYHQDKLMKQDKLIGNFIVNAVGRREHIALKEVRQYI